MYLYVLHKCGYYDVLVTPESPSSVTYEKIAYNQTQICATNLIDLISLYIVCYKFYSYPSCTSVRKHISKKV